MTRLFRFNLFAGIVLASIWTATAPSARAQGAPAEAPARDSIAIQDIERAAEQLAEAVQAAVRKASEDPAVKVAALKVAKNAVTAAQITLTQQANALEKLLDALARDIAMATDKQQEKAKTP